MSASEALTTLFLTMLQTLWPWLLVLAALGVVGEAISPATRGRRRRKSGESDGEFALRGAVLAVLLVILGATTAFGAAALALGLALGASSAFLWWRAIRRRQAFARTGLTREQIAALSPKDFEGWCAVRLRELGYSVREVGRQGDHGIDLLADKDGTRTVVQCKRWSSGRLIGEPELRDLYGAMHASGAQEATVITTGAFSEPARLWAEGKPIRLWDVDRLVSVPAAPVPEAAALPRVSSPCSACGRALVRRTNRRTGEPFWGCSGYPSCRYTQPAT